jgi:hypothetical protein
MGLLALLLVLIGLVLEIGGFVWQNTAGGTGIYAGINVGYLAVLLGFGGLLLAQPRRTRLGSWLAGTCSLAALGFAIVAVVKHATDSGISSILSTTSWSHAGSDLALAAIPFALISERLGRQRTVAAFAVVSTISIAMAVYATYRSPTLSSTFWYGIAGIPALLAVAAATTRLHRAVLDDADATWLQRRRR